MVHNIAQASLTGISPDTRFLLDTNVLYFIHAGYPGRPGSQYSNKCAQYSSFVIDLIRNGFHLYTTAANVQELLHVIENKEYRLYCQRNHLSRSYGAQNFFSKKDFRGLPSERSRLAQVFSAVVGQIESTYLIFDVSLLEKRVSSFAGTLANHRYDPMDYIVVEDSLSFGRVNFITDDQDFQADTRLQVWTV